MRTSENSRSALRGRPTRRRVLAGLVGLCAVGAGGVPAMGALPLSAQAGAAPAADGSARSIALRSANTGERLDVTYWHDGRLDLGALGRLDALMRDWRNDAVTHIDPALYDIIWSLGRAVGQDPEVTVLCGYRSPETNEMMIRAGRRGVARDSMHIQGRAADISVPSAGLRALRDAALALQAGGVGYYPSSNFVHVDTGAVRSW